MTHSSNRLPVLASVLLTVIGGAAAYALFRVEYDIMAEAVSGRESIASRWHRLRPWALGSLPLLPAIGSYAYLLGDRLDRYLARGFLSTFGMTIATLLAIWLLGDLNDNWSDFGKTENSLSIALRYYLSQFPAIMVLTLPYALLISLLYLLGKLSRSCEVVMILQCGRSLLRLAAPFLVGGVLLSLACLVFNFHWAPQAERYKDGILRGARVGKDGRAGLTNVVYNNEETQRIWRAGFLPSEHESGAPLEEVTVESFSAPGVLDYVILADRAVFNPDDSSWTFKGAKRMDYRSETPRITPLPPAYRVSRFSETPWQFLNPTLQPEQRGVPSLSERLASPRIGDVEERRLQTQRFLRVANSLTCLVVVAIALPLGVVLTRRGTATGVATAIFIGASMIFSAEVFPSFSEAGYLPPWLGAFATHILFISLAFILIHRRLHGRPIYAQLRTLFGGRD